MKLPDHIQQETDSFRAAQLYESWFTNVNDHRPSTMDIFAAGAAWHSGNSAGSFGGDNVQEQLLDAAFDTWQRERLAQPDREAMRLALIAALAILPPALSEDHNPAGWRCFHCGEYFANPNLAEAHFGDFTGAKPACILKQEQGLVYLFRDQEKELREFRSGETKAYHEFHALGASHAVALIREEQKGYDRGLADGRNETLESSVTVAHETRDERQRRVANWCRRAFGAAQQSSIPQRGIRLLEEAVECAQAAGCERSMAHQLVDYVFDRPPGELFQELGGVDVTVLALAAAASVSADQAEQTEVARVLAKPLAHFAARNQAKNDVGFLATAKLESNVDTDDALPIEVDPLEPGMCS